MVKIGCPAVTTLQFQGLKEMDMASAVVLSSLPLTKKKTELFSRILYRGEFTFFQRWGLLLHRDFSN